MMWFYAACCLLLIAGIFAVFGIRLSDFAAAFQFKSHETVRDKVLILQGQTPKGLIRRRQYEIRQILISTGREGIYTTIQQLSFLLAIAGLVLAGLLDNWYLAIPFAAAGFLTPQWYIRSTVATYKRQLNGELETALSIITTSYLRTEDIVKSVQENINYINEPIRTHFSAFLTEIQMINANTTAAINNLKTKVPNAIFHEWCDTLIQCQTDRTMKEILPAVVQKFSDVRVVQAELDTMIASPRFEALCMILLVIGNVPFMYFLNRDWFDTLVFSTPGKLTLGIIACVVVFAVSRIIHLSRPIEYTR